LSLGAIVLVGGKSSRFGSDKGNALLQGKTLLEWSVQSVAGIAERTVIVKAPSQQIAVSDDGVYIADDQYLNRGPLAGLITGFDSLDTELAIVIGCDTPLIVPELWSLFVEAIKGCDLVVPRINGLLQPLVALYRRDTCKKVFIHAFKNGENKVIDAFVGLKIYEIEEKEIKKIDPRLVSFHNVNTRENLVEAENILKMGAQ
tara:strand:- start:24 stop:629 length:606 start_codon:yes stop_codon:yes gene_type:complete